MSQTGTPTEFLKLGITEPDDTLNVLVDLNGQWEKIDTGVKNVDTKANTNASGISALNTAVQDNTENITNILETNVNQQTSIDTLQSKVATLEEDDTSYGSRITAVEAGVQENSELINDLEVDLSGVKTSVGTVPDGSNLQGEVNGLDTRVTTLETEVGTVPAGETVQGQITTLNGQVNSGNIPFRFSVDGGGNYGYLKADDSFVPFKSGDSHWKVVDTELYVGDTDALSFILKYKGWNTQGSPNYGKLHDMKHNIDYTLPNVSNLHIVGNIIHLYYNENNYYYIANNGSLIPINGVVAGARYHYMNDNTYYLIKSGNNITYNIVDGEGNSIGQPVNYTLHGNASGAINFNSGIGYRYNNTYYDVTFDTQTGTHNETTITVGFSIPFTHYFTDHGDPYRIYYDVHSGSSGSDGYSDYANRICISQEPIFIYHGGKYYYYL